MGSEGCSYPSVKCKKRVTVLVEGGEIELFDGEVSARFPLPFLSLGLSGVFTTCSWRTVLLEWAATVEKEV